MHGVEEQGLGLEVGARCMTHVGPDIGGGPVGQRGEGGAFALEVADDGGRVEGERAVVGGRPAARGRRG